MKHRGLLLVFIAAALITFGLSSTALAFHAGGVATCDGCHTMHNSINGEPVAGTGPDRSALTLGSDPSSTCLNCHYDAPAGRSSSYHVMSDDGHYLHAGGDFFWVRKDYSYIVRGNTITSYGQDHGHSIVAEDYGMTAQTGAGSVSPGGDYPVAYLGCTSCHDPHGTVTTRTGAIGVSGSYGGDVPAGTIAGNFRLLADNGYRTQNLTYTLPDGPPKAVSTNDSVTDDHHTDYGQYMTAFCANCHGEFANMPLKHPVGPVNGSLGKTNNTTGQTYAMTYNNYVKTGDFSGGANGWPSPVGTGPYLELVPFERNTDTGLAIDSTDGPNGSSNVMCLTCHRAHASAFDSAGRWDFSVEFVAESHPAEGDIDVGDITPGTAPQITAYYGRDMESLFGEFQRSLCNKCHAKD